jgi:hypothetical protein
MFIFLPQSAYSSDNQERRIVETLKCSQSKYKMYSPKITILDFKDLPYNKGLKSIKKAKYYDDNLIPLHNYKGKLNYHPVFLAQNALKLIDIYNTTQKFKYLKSAKRIANKLLSISLQIKSSIIFLKYPKNLPPIQKALIISRAE